MAGDRWATFDCYGTLIDWMGGIRDTLGPVARARRRAAVSAYHEIEPEVQHGRSVTYRQVLAESLERVAHREGLELEDDDGGARRVAHVAAVPRGARLAAELRTRGWKLGILSNTDPDYLEASFELIGVPTDERVTASEIGSYKPAHGHWTTFFERTGADRERHVHVAASLFHDIAPANELGLQAVWINRMHEYSDLPRVAELPT